MNIYEHMRHENALFRLRVNRVKVDIKHRQLLPDNANKGIIIGRK